MKSVWKTIFGSMARHWVGALLGVVVGKWGITEEHGRGLLDIFTDDFVFNAVTALGVSVLPVAVSVWTRLKTKLERQLALWLPARATTAEVKGVISETPLKDRVRAVLTVDPAHLDLAVAGANDTQREKGNE
jgi:hypothetical protein